MDAEKIRNLTGPELLQQQRDLNDQLFRLKFQLKMGQTESLKKIRGLRKDVARIKTIQREQELGIEHKQAALRPKPEKTTVAAKPAAAAKRAATRKSVKATATKKRKK